jgi:hypothetical protein
MRFLKFSLLQFVIFAFSFIFVAGASFADEQIQMPLNRTTATKLTVRCAWAPHDSSVCRARASCIGHPQNRRCAKYCNVNPYDVVCGDFYHQAPQASEPSEGTPYPWAQSGTFCQEYPYHSVCRYEDGLFENQGFGY